MKLSVIFPAPLTFVCGELLINGQLVKSSRSGQPVDVILPPNLFPLGQLGASGPPNTGRHRDVKPGPNSTGDQTESVIRSFPVFRCVCWAAKQLEIHTDQDSRNLCLSHSVT